VKSLDQNGREKHLDFVLDEQRVGRMWEVVESRTNLGRKRRTTVAGLWTVGFGVVGFCLALFFRSQAPQAGDMRNGTSIVTSAAHETVTLPDGSTAEIAPRTRLTLLDATRSNVRIQLLQGEVSFAVTHRAEPHFVVEAWGVLASVRGTRFSVQLTPDTVPPMVSVHVTDGSVQISDTWGISRASLQAGQNWSSPVPLIAVESDSNAEPATKAKIASEPEKTPRVSQPSATFTGSNAELSPGQTDERRSAAVPTDGVPTAEALFAAGRAARLAHHAAEAAADFDRLRRARPNDSRAGVAAFELGRIQLRELGDPAGALEAFRFALGRARSGAYREDARAGVIEALARLGRREECGQALAAFQRESPKSIHQRRLAAACEGK